MSWAPARHAPGRVPAALRTAPTYRTRVPERICTFIERKYSYIFRDTDSLGRREPRESTACGATSGVSPCFGCLGEIVEEDAVPDARRVPGFRHLEGRELAVVADNRVRRLVSRIPVEVRQAL